MTTDEQLSAALQELADMKAGIPSHSHTNTKGQIWRCVSPYCERGNDVRDEPQVGAAETDIEGAKLRYRRQGNA